MIALNFMIILFVLIGGFVLMLILAKIFGAAYKGYGIKGLLVLLPLFLVLFFSEEIFNYLLANNKNLLKIFFVILALVPTGFFLKYVANCEKAKRKQVFLLGLLLIVPLILLCFAIYLMLL